MVAPFYHEQALTVDGEQLRLVINFAAIDATESLLAPMTFADIIGQLVLGTASMSVQAKVVWGLLREHHSDLTIDQATTLLMGPTGEATGIAVNRLLTAAFPPAEPKKAKGANPPKPRGASKPS